MILCFKIICLYILLIVIFNIIFKNKYSFLITIIFIINILINYIFDNLDILNLVVLIPIIYITNEIINDKFKMVGIEIIKNGKINSENINNSRYSITKLISNLKKSNIHSLSEVNLAVLKNNKLIIKKNYGYPVPIIISGEINYDSLKKIGKTSFWLINNMEDKKISLDDVFYAFYLGNQTYFIKKN